MKSLSITNRLTLTFAFLTAAILAPAALALYLSVASAYTAASVEKAKGRARSIASSLLTQLDEDFFVEFEGAPFDFSGLRTRDEDWALVRGETAEYAVGVFDGDSAVWGRTPDDVFVRNSLSLRVAGVPLVADVSPSLEDLPPAIRQVAASRYPDAPYLGTTQEMNKAGAVSFEVRKLLAGRIAEIKVWATGEFKKEGSENLPTQFDRRYFDYLPPESRPAGPITLTWRAYSGQPIAVIEGTTEAGERKRFAMSRLGERFIVDESGAVRGRDEESRLMVFAALDVKAELARKNMLLGGLVVGVVCIWLGLVFTGRFVVRRAMAPVDDIVEAARKIRLSDLRDRVPVGEADDELARIATTINRMLDRLEVSYRRERQFTGDASHELRGPLTKIQADVELALGRERTDEEYRQALGRIRGYSRGMKRLVESLLLLARLDGNQELLEKTRFDLTEVLVETVGTLAEGDGRRIHIQLDNTNGPVEALGERSLISTAIHNLIENALRYSPQTAQVDVRVHPNGGNVIVEVEDQGAGIEPGQREHVFGRFVRVDSARTRETGGCGLGLSIVRAVAEAHGTRVDLRPSETGGTIAAFEVRSS